MFCSDKGVTLFKHQCYKRATLKARMVEWWNGGMVEWWNGGMVEWRNGGMAEWRNGGMAEWRNGGVAEWRKMTPNPKARNGGK